MTSSSLGVRCLPRPRARSSSASCSKTNVRAGASCCDEVVVAQAEAERLPADGGGGLEVVDDLQPVRRPGQGGERRVAEADLDRLADDQRLDGRRPARRCRRPGSPRRTAWLLPSPPGSSPTCPPETLTTALSIAHARQGGHAVLDGLDEQRAVAQARAPRAFKDVLDQGGDGGDLAVLLADERDARPDSAGANVSVAGSPENSPSPLRRLRGKMSSAEWAQAVRLRRKGRL